MWGPLKGVVLFLPCWQVHHLSLSAFSCPRFAPKFLLVLSHRCFRVIAVAHSVASSISSTLHPFLEVLGGVPPLDNLG